MNLNPSIPNQKMTASILIEFASTFHKGVFALASAWLVSLFGDSWINLLTGLDLGYWGEIISTFFTAFMTLVGMRWFQLKRKEEALALEQDRLHKEQDQYKENVKWLVSEEYIKKGASKAEIDAAMKVHFPEK